jgi:hypothetical protein
MHKCLCYNKSVYIYNFLFSEYCKPLFSYVNPAFFFKNYSSTCIILTYAPVSPFPFYFFSLQRIESLFFSHYNFLFCFLVVNVSFLLVNVRLLWHQTVFFFKYLFLTYRLHQFWLYINCSHFQTCFLYEAV